MSLLQKPAAALTSDDYSKLVKKVGERFPYPGMGLGYTVGQDGKWKVTRYLGVLDRAMQLLSERSQDEVEGLLIRNMPTPEMLRLLFDAVSSLDPQNRRRVMSLKGAPGAGKTFLFELLGNVASNKGPIYVDCTNLNLNELFFETVLDFKANQSFYDALDDKIARYNAAKKEQREFIINPLSVDILRDCLGEALTEEDGALNIDWAKVKHGHRDSHGVLLDTKESIEIALTGLLKVRAKEGLERLGGNTLGMATQEGPAWHAYKDGRLLILDELSRAKKGTFGIMHRWMQFMIGEIDECRVNNPLKEKGDQIWTELHFRRSEMAAGCFVGMTSNMEDDGSEVNELPQALSSRVVPDEIPQASLRGWQHRWCQILTGMPVSTLYHMQSDVWDKDPEAFTRYLLKARFLGEDKEVPQDHVNRLRRWPDIMQATDYLARFMDSVAKTIDPDSEWHRAGTLTKLLDDLTEIFNRQASIDFRKIGYFMAKGGLPKPLVRPVSGEAGASIAPFINEADRADSPDDIQGKIGTYLTYAVIDWVIANSYDTGKNNLGNQLMQIAVDCGLIYPHLEESLESSRRLLAELLDENPCNSTDPEVHAHLVRDLLCDYLRGLYPDIEVPNDDIMPVSVVRRAMDNLPGDGPDFPILNDDPETVDHSPLRAAVCVDATPAGGGEPIRVPEPEELVSRQALLSALAAPRLRDRALGHLWDQALLRSGSVDAGSDALPDEGLAIAENADDADFAVASVVVSDGACAEEATPQLLHIAWNKAAGRILAVGDGAISPGLKRAFNNSGGLYVDRTGTTAGKDLDRALTYVIGRAGKGCDAALLRAFKMRNGLSSPEQEARVSTSAAFLLHDDLRCFLPRYAVRKPVLQAA